VQVQGFVQDNRTGQKVAMLIGKWDEAMYYVLGDPSVKPKGYDPMSEAVLLWERDKSVNQTRYNLSPFAISLNELSPHLLKKLPPTDSRLRPDQRHLENGEYEMANAEKLRLEQQQRQVCTIMTCPFCEMLLWLLSFHNKAVRRCYLGLHFVFAGIS
jgi:oxysterol-binding protein 1